MLNHSCIPGIKPLWSCWMIFLMCFWIVFARILLSILESVTIQQIVQKFSFFVEYFCGLIPQQLQHQKMSFAMFLLFRFHEITWGVMLETLFLTVWKNCASGPGPSLVERKLFISFWFSNLVDYNFIKSILIFLWIYLVSVFMSPFFFLIFVILDILSLPFS